MEIRLIHEFPPSAGNPRNSEGAFLRGRGEGEILFAYSRYRGDSFHDHAACDIALCVSHDEGRSWSEPRIIAAASEFGTQNIMSVSAVEQADGRLGFYFLIKENDFTTTLGRTLSEDGVHFVAERCVSKFACATGAWWHLRPMFRPRRTARGVIVRWWRRHLFPRMTARAFTKPILILRPPTP